MRAGVRVDIGLLRATVIEEFDEDTINDVTDNIVLKAPESIQVSACENAKFDVQLDGDTLVDILVEGRPPLALEYTDETVSFKRLQKLWINLAIGL